MGIFGKKKEKEDNLKDNEKEESGKEGVEGERARVKKIKDLSPGNKKRRKEPIRAWNKFDRIVLLLIIIFTAGTASFLALSSRGYKLPNLPRLSIPKYNLFGERIVVLESNGKDKKKAEKIVNDFNVATKELTGVYGLYVVDADNNFSFGVYDNENFQAASLIKLPVMVGMYQEEESGVFELDSKYKLTARDKVKGSGSLYNKPVGYELSYRDLIRLMGKESDNTAFNICRKYLGDEKIRRIISQIGMKDTSLEMNETTPYDIGLFFHKLWDGEIINRTDSNELLGFMTDTIYENWLVVGIPEGIRVAHKYGREVKTVNDAGIIFAGNPYIIVILSKDIKLNEADAVFPKLSGIVYREMTTD